MSNDWLQMFGTWLLRLFGYDGLLPAVVLLLPAVLATIFGPGLIIELTAVCLPIVAFFVRSAVGLHQIEQNHCRASIRLVQKATLFVGLLALLLVDAFIILTWGIPRNALTLGDYLTTLCFYLVYLALMAISSFPGIAATTGDSLNLDSNAVRRT